MGQSINGYDIIFQAVIGEQKKLFAGTIEQMLEAEMDEHLGYEKNSVAGNNSGNSRKQDVCAAAPKVRHGRRTT